MLARLAAAASPAPRHPWSRLVLLATLATLPVLAAVLVFSWLTPTNARRYVDYPLADLEVGVPAFFRPFDMGGKGGRQDGIWLVRTDTTVEAFWSALPHPNACGLRSEYITKFERAEAGPGANATPVPAVRAPAFPGATPAPPVPGFRDLCLGATFLLDGTPSFAGPAWRALDRFPATIEAGTVRIDTTHVILGACQRYQFSYNCSEPGYEVTQRMTWPRP